MPEAVSGQPFTWECGSPMEVSYKHVDVLCVRRQTTQHSYVMVDFAWGSVPMYEQIRITLGRHASSSRMVDSSGVNIVVLDDDPAVTRQWRGSHEEVSI